MLRAANLLPDAAKFNKMAPAKKLEELEKALASLARNPVFRERLIHTFDVQLGTLSDNLFGINGILGKLGAGPFDGVLNGLVALNKGIESTTPQIVDRIMRFVLALQQAADMIPKFDGSGSKGAASAMRAGLASNSGSAAVMGAVNAASAISAITSSERARAASLILHNEVPFDSKTGVSGQWDRALAEVRRRDIERKKQLGLFKDVTGRRSHQPASEFHELMHPSKTNPDAGITKQTVIQHIKIELDLDTDISPEAFVQRADRAFRKAAAKQAVFPTKGKGAPAPIPRMSSIP
jgi:hypothetical protein